ncbi:hypothetical protein ACIPSD_12330 [Pectobacterium sp. CHL-2024]|uniref:hypothetical protein n=1 Tax=Pectobacterium sp. CHL-2024 TaxID=3377079 RepID=UPI0038063792
MLESYFGNSGVLAAQRQRLLAVQAALEIAKASVGATTSLTGIKTETDLKTVAKEISALADAIQNSLKIGGK